MQIAIDLDHQGLTEFARRHRVTELALFGSVVRDDFRPDSDVDVIVEFEPGAGRDFFELQDMKRELEQIFGRRVDLLTKRSLKPRFRAIVLPEAVVVYAT